jgi:hypothetical protein
MGSEMGSEYGKDSILRGIVNARQSGVINAFGNARHILEFLGGLQC